MIKPKARPIYVFLFTNCVFMWSVIAVCGTFRTVEVLPVWLHVWATLAASAVGVLALLMTVVTAWTLVIVHATDLPRTPFLRTNCLLSAVTTVNCFYVAWWACWPLM